MPLEAAGTFKKDGRSQTGRIYVPAALVRDSQFPLEEGKVEIEIRDNELVIKPTPGKVYKGLSSPDT